MEISRYASRLAPTSSVLPSGRPTGDESEASDLIVQATQRSELFPKELPQEPDDARLTGGTRSLSRRLLALNIPSISAPRVPSAKAAKGISLHNPKVLQDRKVRKTLVAKAGLVA